MEKIMNIEQLHHAVPSAFQLNKSVDRSDKYEVISTPTIVDTLLNQGFAIDKAIQAKTRKDIWQGYQKHQIFFDIPGYENTERKIQLRVVNSYNGGSRLLMYIGVYEFVCSNGLVRSSGQEEQFGIRHQGNQAKNFQVELNRLLCAIPNTVKSINKMSEKMLSEEDKMKFAVYALGLRWKVEDLPFNPQVVLSNWHPQQGENTVWNVFNRIQENLTQGFTYYHGRKRKSFRKVSGIDTDISINQKLWQYAETLA